MKVIIKNDTTIDEEMKHIELLNKLIRDDMDNKDKKSLDYHLIALDSHIKKLKQLTDEEKKKDDFEISL